MKNFELEFYEINLYTLHTTFILTDDVTEKIKNCGGVNEIYPRGKYKLLLEIGKLFTLEEVNTNLELLINP